MEAFYSAETLVLTYQTTWRYRPEDCNLNIYQRDNYNFQLNGRFWRRKRVPGGSKRTLLVCYVCVREERIHETIY